MPTTTPSLQKVIIAVVGGLMLLYALSVFIATTLFGQNANFGNIILKSAISITPSPSIPPTSP